MGPGASQRAGGRHGHPGRARVRHVSLVVSPGGAPRAWHRLLRPRRPESLRVVRRPRAVGDHRRVPADAHPAGGDRPRRVHRVLRRAGDDRRFPGAPRGGGARRRDAGGHREGARAERVVPQHDDDPGQGTRLRVQPGADRHGVVDRHRWRRVAVDRPDHRAARQLVGIVVRVVINAVAIYLAAGVVPGIALRGEAIWPALLAAFVLAALNAIVRPLLVLITLPLTLVTLGLFLLV